MKKRNIFGCLIVAFIMLLSGCKKTATTEMIEQYNHVLAINELFDTYSTESYDGLEKYVKSNLWKTENVDPDQIFAMNIETNLPAMNWNVIFGGEENELHDILTSITEAHDRLHTQLYNTDEWKLWTEYKVTDNSKPLTVPVIDENGKYTEDEVISARIQYCPFCLYYHEHNEECGYWDYLYFFDKDYDKTQYNFWEAEKTYARQKQSDKGYLEMRKQYILCLYADSTETRTPDQLSNMLTQSWINMKIKDQSKFEDDLKYLPLVITGKIKRMEKQQSLSSYIIDVDGYDCWFKSKGDKYEIYQYYTAFNEEDPFISVNTYDNLKMGLTNDEFLQYRTLYTDADMNRLNIGDTIQVIGIVEPSILFFGVDYKLKYCDIVRVNGEPFVELYGLK